MNANPTPAPAGILTLLLGALRNITGSSAVYRIYEVHSDSVKLPLAREWGKRDAAIQYARILAIWNGNSMVAGYAVGDGEKIIFTAPANGSIGRA